MPCTDSDLWRAAENVIAAYGDGASDYLVERMLDASRAAREGDVTMWQSIARRVSLLNATPHDARTNS